MMKKIESVLFGVVLGLTLFALVKQVLGLALGLVPLAIFLYVYRERVVETLDRYLSEKN